ncbi:MAG TPA: ATP-binding protein [Pyrinomonadaceae bacterium]|nr:ATP-binding protein [Pyrinomonadaceae bacterium]
MDADTLSSNAVCIRNEIDWFRQTMELRFKLHAAGNQKGDPFREIEPPDLNGCGSYYASVVQRFDMGCPERLVLILSYIPHVRPDVLDPFFIQNQSIQRRFTEFGGLTGLAHGGFLPTGETAMFLLAGNSIQQRLRFDSLFSHEHYFYINNILRLNQPHPEEPRLSSLLQLTPEYLERLTTGRAYHPPFSPEFPAQLLTTLYEWADLVLDAPTYQKIEDIATWVRHQHTIMEDWMLKKRIKPGFRSLFYGPPGTGKTLTACLLGKVTGSSVYRIDLSKIVSKYIGETEKNLASLFDQAQHQNWILFFDEADSLFGKRTESHSANDRAANQQVSYLLQRIEDFPGVVILATNLRSHLDDAFARRFQSMIHFPLPGFEQRLRLWEDNFKDKPYRLAADVDLRKLASDYELPGGSIVNVLRYACLKAVVRTPREIRAQDLLRGVRNELHKEGKFLKQQNQDSVMRG